MIFSDALIPDMLKIFEAVPDLYLILSTDLRTLTASNAYINALQTTRQEMIGKNILENFPGNPYTFSQAVPDKVRTSCQITIDSCKEHQITLPANALPLLIRADNSGEESHWRITHTPVFNEQEKVQYIIHKVSSQAGLLPAQPPVQRAEDKNSQPFIESVWQWPMLQTFFMQAPVAIAIFRGEKYIVEIANPKACEIIGYTAEQILGKPFFEAVPEISGQGYEEILANVFHTGVPYTIQEAPVLLKRAGKLIQGFFNTVYQPFTDDKGKIIGVLNTVFEVTEQVLARQAIEQVNEQLEQQVKIRTMELKAAQANAESERSKLYHLLMQAPAMICIFEGPQHIFRLVNPPYQQLVGNRPILGKSIHEAMPELKEQPIFSLLNTVYQTGETFYAHEMMVQLDHANTGRLGENYYNFIYQATRDIEGTINGILVFAYEVTDLVLARKKSEQSEEKLQNLNHELAATNEELLSTNDELIRATEELEHLNRELENRVQLRTQALELAQVEIKRQKERLERFFMQAPSAVCVLDGPDMVYELVNPAYQQFFPGRSLLGKPILEALPELEGQPIITILENVYKEGETFEGKEIMVSLARHEHMPVQNLYFSFIYQPRYNEKGQIDGILVFAHEVTEQVVSRQKVEESEKQLRLITDALPVLISYLDKEERYRFVNKAYESWFHLSPSDLIGKTALEVVGPKAYQNIKNYINRALAGERIDFEARMPYRDNFVKHIHTSYVPDLQDGNIVGFYALITDVTEQVEARQKVEESEKRVRTLLESIPQITWTALPSGEIYYYNQRWYEYTGFTFEESKAWGWQAVLHPDDLPIVLEVYQQALRSGEGFALECRLKRSQDGEYRWHLSRTLPLHGEKNTLTGWIGTATDIHEQKLVEQQLLEREEYFRMMTNNTPVMIWVTRPDGYCTYLNKPWYDYTGQTEEEAAGLGWTMATHPEDVEKAGRIFMEANENRSVFRLSYRLRRKDGTYRWFTDLGLPRFSPAGEFEGFVGAVLDIHEQKLAEEALQQSAQELAAANEEIQTSNDELSISNQQLAYMNADMDNFIYTASHDLKAPIVNIEGLMRVLIKHLSKESLENEKTQRTISYIQDSILRFKHTIANLTEVVKLQKENSQPAIWVDVNRLLEEVKSDLATEIKKAKAHIVTDVTECPMIQFSEKNLRSILYNLLSNAIKYRSPGRRLKVKIHCTQTKDYQQLSIQDNGLGMNLSGDQKLFSMFRRLHTHVEGSGIGLYMVKKMIDNAGGKIEVESEEGLGSTFKVYFKRKPKN